MHGEILKFEKCKDNFHWMALIKKKTWSDDGLLTESKLLPRKFMYVFCKVCSNKRSYRPCASDKISYLHNYCHVLCTGSN